MAQVILRGAGWYSDFRAGGRRIRRFLAKDKRLAQVELGKLLDTFRGDAAGKPSKRITWAEFKTRYFEYGEGAKRPQTVLRDRAAILALEKTFPITALGQITPELLERWKAARLADGKGKATVSRDLKAVKAMLHKAVAWGYTDKLAWHSVKPIKTTRKKLYFHSPEELAALLAICHGPWKTICLLGARAGLRREEIRMLTWEDVDFTTNRIHVTPKEGWEPKDYEQRFIGLAADLREHLLSLKRKGPWVIGERPNLGVMSAYFQKLSRRAGLRGSLHILRHTFASHLVQAGVPLKTVKELLGHSSMATTEIYAHLTPQNLDQAVSLLPPIPGSGLGSGHNARTATKRHSAP